ncbi:UPF0496 protein At3g19330-like isoform X1 [Camellia sinensis]|uniref:UPF0496 protein At3g19330-like isoform X1 n=1 Tax=Camellia sinensis TaxID=4442 RepID=UPI00103664FC|nr:UPF0496 protein At3g19330-like isoform X1 [Camellia sinensis]XP_028108351.1 UPF0496 protein At3g19330-like isoform X1 [Camellia sinensis]XP_028108352.1 UPF0496 protein At3g19330-like isoform X1 [Camellia sinensis]
MHNQMLHCAMPSSSTRRSNLHSSLSPLQGSSADITPSSSTQPSPTVNLTCEYTLAKQTDSYSEIWSKIHSSYSYEDPNLGQGEAREDQQLAQVLNPSQECVQEALRHATPSTLTRLVSTYFDHSGNTSHLCLLLLDNVQHARSLYYDLHNLLDVLPLDSDPNSLTQAQCDRAFDIFLQFDRLGNPFPRPDSHNFHDMRHCFSQLNQKLHHRLCKSRSRVHLLRRAASCSAICFIGTVVGVSIAAVAIASHALIAFVAGPFLPALVPTKISKKALSHLAQLDAAAKGTYVLHNDLNTIDRLVERLYTAIEGDKFLIRLGLDRGRERHPIHEVAKQLQKNHHNFLSQLMDLEEHICLCFATINRARSLLLKEIYLHQSHYSEPICCMNQYYSSTWLDENPNRVPPYRDEEISSMKNKCFKKYFPNLEERRVVNVEYAKFSGGLDMFGDFDSKIDR